MRYAMKNCENCGELKEETVYCYTCPATGCRECIRPIIGSDGEIWHCCEECTDWGIIAEAIRDESQKTVAVARQR